LKQVLVAVQSKVLGAGLESLLKPANGFSVRRIAPNISDIVQAKIDRTLPTVLVLDEAPGLRRLLPVLEAFWGHPDLKILVVNAASNLVQVYGRRELYLTAATDLVQVVQSG
jgi:hypothetical protein